MVSSTAARRAKENEWLSDLMHHPGWEVVKDMAKGLELSLMGKALEDAPTEWDAIKKDGILRAISVLRTHIAQVEGRGEEYRKRRANQVHTIKDL